MLRSCLVISLLLLVAAPAVADDWWEKDARAGFDLDFSNSRYVHSHTTDEPLDELRHFEFTRATVATHRDITLELLRSATDVPRVSRRGLLVEDDGAANLLANPEAPAAQTVSVSAVPHVLTMRGSGSVTVSGAATGTAREGEPLVFTPAAGRLTVAVAGTVRVFNLYQGSAESSFRPAALGANARAGDVATIAAPAMTAATVKLELTAAPAGARSQIDFGNERDAGNFLRLVRDEDGRLSLFVYQDGSVSAAIPDGEAPAFVGKTGCIVIRYADDHAALFLDGVKIGELSAVTLPDLNRIYLSRGGGNGSANTYIQRVTAIPDALDASTILRRWPAWRYTLPQALTRYQRLVDPIVLDLGRTPPDEPPGVWDPATQSVRYTGRRNPNWPPFPEDRDLLVIGARGHVKTMEQRIRGGRRVRFVGGQVNDRVFLTHGASYMSEGRVFEGHPPALNVTSGLANDPLQMRLRRNAATAVEDTYVYDWRFRYTNIGGYVNALHGDLYQAHGSLGAFGKYSGIEQFTGTSWLNGVFASQQVFGSLTETLTSTTLTPGDGALRVDHVNAEIADTGSGSGRAFTSKVRFRNVSGGKVGGIDIEKQTYLLASFDETGFTVRMPGMRGGPPVKRDFTLDTYYGPYPDQTPRSTRFDIKNGNITGLIQRHIRNADGSGRPTVDMQNLYWPLDPGGTRRPLALGPGGTVPFPQYLDEFYLTPWRGTQDTGYIARIEPVSPEFNAGHYIGPATFRGLWKSGVTHAWTGLSWTPRIRRVDGRFEASWNPALMIHGVAKEGPPPGGDFMPANPNGGGLGVAGRYYFSPLEVAEF